MKAGSGKLLYLTSVSNLSAYLAQYQSKRASLSPHVSQANPEKPEQYFIFTRLRSRDRGTRPTQAIATGYITLVGLPLDCTRSGISADISGKMTVEEFCQFYRGVSSAFLAVSADDDSSGASTSIDPTLNRNRFPAVPTPTPVPTPTVCAGSVEIEHSDHNPPFDQAPARAAKSEDSIK